MKTKTALVTGATSGIGRAVALRLAREGVRLIVNGRRAARLEEVKREIEAACATAVCTLPFDVRNRGAVERSLAGLPDEWQRIDILVNNAGLAAGMAPVHEGAVDDWERMIDTNIKGLLYVTRAVAPGMVARGAGHVINIGSIAGRSVYPGGSVYCATKHAVAALSEGMRMDLLPFGIRVTQICPGAVETEFSLVRFDGDASRAARVYAGFTPLTGADIAEAVCFAATQPAHVNIQDLLVMPAAQAGATMIHREI
ncbi:MAG: SDR family oxidoreductase [Tannerella sp.]|jgi:NADP-dependent 3-hydroxy acid dehydrogenase YdfG|nr:SDR family oxidoreductase [Tannerella sp.]